MQMWLPFIIIIIVIIIIFKNNKEVKYLIHRKKLLARFIASMSCIAFIMIGTYGE